MIQEDVIRLDISNEHPTTYCICIMYLDGIIFVNIFFCLQDKTNVCTLYSVVYISMEIVCNVQKCAPKLLK